VRVVTDEARAQARRGNVLAADIEAIYDQYRHRVYVWCLCIARNVEDAEDLTQDAFLLLCRKINTYRQRASPLNSARHVIRVLVCRCEF
jgi:DNA-directed RNA polymerase specialized sigma24 family protein